MSWNALLRIPGHFLGMIRGFYNLIGDRVSLNLTKGHVALFVWGGSISQLFIFLVSLLLNLAHQHFLPQAPSGFHLFPSCSFSSFAGSDFFRFHVERAKVGQGWHVLFATTAVFHGGSRHFSVWFHLIWIASSWHLNIIPSGHCQAYADTFAAHC